MEWKRKLIIMAVPAALAVGGGAMVAAHAATPNPPAAPNASQTTEPAESPTESGATTETTDPAEPAGTTQGAGSGHADPAGQVDHQFDGQE